MRFLKILLLVAIIGCSTLGAGVLLFFGLHAVGIFNDPGKVDPQAQLFSLTAEQVDQAKETVTSVYAETAEVPTTMSQENPWPFLCKLTETRKRFPSTAQRIYDVYHTMDRPVVAEYMLTALRIRHPELYDVFTACDASTVQNIITESITSSDTVQDDGGEGVAVSKNEIALSDSAYPWMDSDEWEVLSTALARDRDVIMKTAEQLQMSPRLLVVPIIGEQLRYYTADRSTFKSYLKPVQQFMYLGKFSYGIAGMKPETAERVELNLKNPQSPFYLGPEYEHLLDYPETVTDIPAERMLRINNKKDHTWVYLYVGMYLKQFEAQWRNAGFPIDGRPDILATLYNLGHNRSIPKENPDAGGTPITINDRQYTFGGLAYDFYWSGVLLDLFPY